jgi:hypothetical protein
MTIYFGGLAFARTEHAQSFGVKTIATVIIFFFEVGNLEPTGIGISSAFSLQQRYGL